MTKQRGFGIVEALIGLAIFGILTAMLGQSLISVMQQNHENNASAGIQNVMTAESTYYKLYGSYVTSANAHKLSDCPVSGAPTASAACLLSRAFTQGAAFKYNQYFFTISTPADAGYLVTAFPVNTSSGRLSYCGANDGLLHGVIAKVPPSLVTAANCDALPAIAQGATVPSTTAYQTAKQGTAIPGSTTTVTLTLPSGTYTVTAAFNFRFPLGSSTNDVTCTLTGAAPIQTLTVPYAQESDSTGHTYLFGNGSFAGVGAVTGPLTLSCVNNTNQTLSPWSASLIATPTTTVVTQ